jgi:hypothetical protein
MTTDNFSFGSMFSVSETILHPKRSDLTMHKVRAHGRFNAAAQDSWAMGQGARYKKAEAWRGHLGTYIDSLTTPLGQQMSCETRCRP